MATLLTPEQKKLMDALKRVGMKKPKRTIPEPKVHICSYDAVTWYYKCLMVSICRIGSSKFVMMWPSALNLMV